MKKINLLPVFLLLLCSCTAPSVVTRIIPEAPEGHFAMGREYIPLESGPVEVELGFDGIQGANLIFDFVVHNDGADSLSVLPGDFYYLVLDSANADAAPLSPWMAVHPDKVLMDYDRSLEEKKKDKGMNTFLGVLQASVNILYYASGFAVTDNPAFITDAVFQTIGTADQYLSQDKMIKSDMALISEEKELVEEEIFRACRIPPGEHGSGYVYFPKHENTAYYLFCFPIENYLFQFVYKQQKELVY
jgi:hypothetical protein